MGRREAVVCKILFRPICKADIDPLLHQGAPVSNPCITKGALNKVNCKTLRCNRIQHYQMHEPRYDAFSRVLRGVQNMGLRGLTIRTFWAPE